MRHRTDRFLKALCFLLTGCFGVLVADAATADGAACTTAIVRSAAGPVCGLLVDTGTGKKASAYLGIPYAQSTAGANRWQPPEPMPPWSTPRSVTSFGAICPQGLPRPGAGKAERSTHHGHATQGAAPVQPPRQSEDCLSLNIWVPADRPASKELPVMVFIYGGAFEAGSSADPLYDGAHLAANQDVILVSFNYRLGAFGFLASAETGASFGFQDQQLALDWVRKNIQAFGGAPDKVTLFGQSAGAMSVGLHLFSAPGSAPLFRAAIMESNVLSLPYRALRDQINLSNLFMAGLNCRDLACLRKVGVDDILAAQAAFTPQMSTVFSGAKFYLPFAPVIDGTVITQQPMAGRPAGGVAKPVILGTNKDEAVLFVGGRTLAAPQYAAWAASLFGADFQKVMARYPAQGDSGLWADLQTDNFFTCSNRHLAAAVTAPLYAYWFDHQPSFPVWGGPTCRATGVVCHGDELPFVFHTAEKIGGHFTAPEETLSKRMMAYWTNFARSLDPNGVPNDGADSLPNWPRYAAERQNYLSLNTASVAPVDFPGSKACGFWDDIGYELTAPWAP
jgi:carboxylesterase type B